MPSGFPGAATVQPAVGRRSVMSFQQGAIAAGLARYAFAVPGGNSCCGLATPDEPNIVQRSVRALCVRGATAIARVCPYGESTNEFSSGSYDACVRCERRTVFCPEAFRLVASSGRCHVLRIADIGVRLAQRQLRSRA